jgi:hypothetical protein
MWRATLVFVLGLAQEEPWEYPFGPLTDAREARLAARIERSFARRGGTGRAMDRLCRHGSEDEGGPPGAGVELMVARNFLMARADRSFALLIDAARRGGHDGASEMVRECGARSAYVVKSGLCSGYDVGGGGVAPDFDTHPLAIERRARAQRTFAELLAAGGPPALVALDILLENNGVCTGLEETVRVATPVLVKMLGAPTTPVRVPLRYSFSEPWEMAFRALSKGGADRKLAQQSVAAFLAYDETAPLAAVTLARMGADATAVVPRLARILGAARPEGARSPGIDQVSDALDALQAIGKAASPALPGVAALAQREGPQCSNMFGADRYVELVRAIATPADAEPAVTVLAPFVRCPGESIRTLKALGEIGAPARQLLLPVLRDGSRTILQRLEAARGLGKPARNALPEEDRRLIALLEAKRGLHKYAPASDWHQLPDSPDVELARCRAEVGLAPVPATGAWSDFSGCLASYLCGPTLDTYAQTMERCCRTFDGHLPRPRAYCGGSRDGGATRD